MKTPRKKKKYLPTPAITYVAMEGGEQNLEKAFSILFEEVMRRRKLSTSPHRQL